jgi:signal recognition particle subunit SRP72
MAMESLMPELASLVEDARAGREDALVPLLAACDRVLALDPSDGSARHAKLVALIELGRYADAEPLAAAAEGSYERAYCLYQLGRGDEALALLPPEGQASEAEAVLAAQILYRDGAYREAARRFQVSCQPITREASSLTRFH